MKTHIAFRLFLITSIIAFYCCKSPEKPSSTVLSGKVKVTWSNSINLRNGTISLAEDWENKTDDRDSIISLNDDGTFKINLQLSKPDFYTISHEQKKFNIYIEPGDSLNINIDKGIIFYGRNAKLNEHYKSLIDIIDNNEEFLSKHIKDFFTSPLTQFNSKIDSLTSEYINYHKDFKINNTTTDIFDNRVLTEIKYRNKSYKLIYPRLYNTFTDKKASVNNSYYNDIAKGSFENPKLLKSPNYALFLDSYIEIQSAGNHKFVNYKDLPIQKIHPRYKAIQELEAHQEIKDYLSKEHLIKSIDNYGITYLVDLIPKFKLDFKDPVLKKQVEELYTEYIERRKEPNEIRVYKEIDNVALEAHIFYPEDFKKEDKRSAYVFFHGGGWALGMPEWGYKNCKKYASKGMVAISFEYRLIDVHGTNIVDCVKDAKSAILWVREQAESLGVDSNKIVAAGFSAGGHLAACTAILDEYEEKDNSGLSSKPNAIIVHSATYNILKSNWLIKNSGDRPESVSSFHQVKSNLVPAILFHGTEDHLSHISEFTEFKDKMEALKNNFEYKIFDGVGHFFNNPQAHKEVDKMTEDFLTKFEFIK